MKRRTRVMLRAAVGGIIIALASDAWAGIRSSPNSTVKLTHDPTAGISTDDWIIGPIAVPDSGSLFPVNPYQINKAFPKRGVANNSEALGSLGHVTNATQSSFVLAAGTGVTQTDPSHVLPGLSMLKIEPDLLWTVTSSNWGGPNDAGTAGWATGFASIKMGGTVGIGGSAELHIELHFENAANPAVELRAPWIENRSYLPGAINDTITTSQLLRLPGEIPGYLPFGQQLHIYGSISFLAANDQTPTDVHPLMLDVGGAPKTAIFKPGAQGSWFSKPNWEDTPAGEDGLIDVPNAPDHRAFFWDSAAATRDVDIPADVRLGTLDISGNASYHFTSLDTNGFHMSAHADYAVINNRGQFLHNVIDAPIYLESSTQIIVETTNQMSILGRLTGTGSVVKRGAGLLVLSESGNYTGGTTVEEGTLQVSNGALATGNVAVGGAVGDHGELLTATLRGTGTVLGNVILNQRGHLAPGNEKIGTISLNRLAVGAGSMMDFRLKYDSVDDATTFDSVNVLSANGFTLPGLGKLTLQDLGGTPPGDYPIIDYAGSPLTSTSFANLALQTPAFGKYIASLVHDTVNTQVKLHLQMAPQWSQDGPGSWAFPGNWIPAAVPTIVANFLNFPTLPTTVTLDTNQSVLSMNFDSSNEYTIARGISGTLTVGDSAHGGSVNVISGTHTISAPLALDGDTTFNLQGQLNITGGLSIHAGRAAIKDGTARMTLSGAQNHGLGSSLTVQRGRLDLNSDAGAAGARLTLNLNGNADGTAVGLVLGANQDLAHLNINFDDAGLQSLDLNSPTTPGGFRMVRVFPGEVTAAKAALWEAILNANPDPTAPSNQDGIFDFHLHANSRIGIMKTNAYVMIRQTRIGDLNLDGVVSIGDFIDMASHFNQIGGATWQEGDVNYDRSVTIADFILLAANFNQTYSGESLGISPAEQQILDDFAAAHGAAAVPEPAGAASLACGLALLGRRRRSKAVVSSL